MTMKVFYEKVASNEITDEVIAFAQKKVDAQSSKDAEKEATRMEILNAVTAEPATAQELAGQLGYSWQKVSSTLNSIYRNGDSNLVKGENADGKRTWAIDAITESDEDEDEVPFDED